MRKLSLSEIISQDIAYFKEVNKGNLSLKSHIYFGPIKQELFKSLLTEKASNKMFTLLSIYKKFSEFLSSSKFSESQFKSFAFQKDLRAPLSYFPLYNSFNTPNITGVCRELNINFTISMKQ